MSLLDRINECNAYSLADFLPFSVAGERVGWVRRLFAARLSAQRGLFEVSPAGVSLADRLATPDERSDALGALIRDWADRGAIKGWRGEMYPVAPRFGQPPLLVMERAAVPHFGVRAYGIHLTGFVRKDDGIHIWVGHRSRDKHTYPGQLDNLVAGGQPVGLGPIENLIKEAGEEAAIPEALARRAMPAGAITYCQETPEGLKPDTIFVFDLELSPDFVPRNTDGEIEAFELWPAGKVLDRVARTTDFKFNCNLVNIDFCVRHGLIGPEEPDYLEIVAGLRRTLP